MTEAAEKIQVIEADVQTESRQLAPAQQEASALLSIIERVALSPDADITKLAQSERSCHQWQSSGNSFVFNEF